jgi:hypothetical protein
LPTPDSPIRRSLKRKSLQGDGWMNGMSSRERESVCVYDTQRENNSICSGSKHLGGEKENENENERERNNAEEREREPFKKSVAHNGE